MSSVASTHCAGCLEAIADGRFLKCYLCRESYDLLCANVSEAYFDVSMTARHGNTWKCQVCRCKEPKADNTNTPVRTVRPDFDDSMFQLEDMSSGELPLATIECDESVKIVCPNRSMSDNITMRRERPRGTTGVPSNSQDRDTFNEDILYLDNVRSIVREELALSVTERMANIISDAVSAKVSGPLHSAIGGLLDRVYILENMVSKLESGSLKSCGEPNCPSRKRILQNLPVERDQGKPIMREPRQRLDAEPNLKMLSSLQHNKRAAKLPIQSQGGRSSAPMPTKTCELVVARDFEHSAASETNPMKDNAGNLIDTGKDRDASDASDGWTEVNRKRPRTVLSRATRGTAVAGTTQLEASERLRRIHLFFVKQGTTDEQVKSHLKCITGSEEIKVESLKSRGPYASFKLTVPYKLFNKVMAPESWPQDVCVKLWSQPFRQRNEKNA